MICTDEWEAAAGMFPVLLAALMIHVGSYCTGFLDVFVPPRGLFWSPDNRSHCEFLVHLPLQSVKNKGCLLDSVVPRGTVYIHGNFSGSL